MAERMRITEQDDRYIEAKAKAKNDPAGIQALVIINLEDLRDETAAQRDALTEHCKAPAILAHPAPKDAPVSEPDATAGLTPGQRYKLAVMEHRGKIAIGITAAIASILVVAFHGVGY